LAKRQAQLAAQIAGYNQQVRATDDQAKLINEEMEGTKSLDVQCRINFGFHLKAQSRVDVIQRAKGGSGRVDRPMRRPQPLHPPAFLVDQDRGIRVFCQVLEFANKIRYLGRRLNIALEQDKAPGPLVADEFALGRVKSKPRYARDECAAAHGAD